MIKVRVRSSYTITAISVHNRGQSFISNSSGMTGQTMEHGVSLDESSGPLVYYVFLKNQFRV